MEEKVIVKSIHAYAKKIKTMGIVVTIFMCVSAVLCLVFYHAWQNFRIKTNFHGMGNFREDRYIYMSFVLMISSIVCVLVWIYYFSISKMQLIVTNKRVYGKIAFGKQVDLPLDSISAVGTSILKGIAVCTSSGKINFLGISNRDEIYEEIKKILADRQEIKVKTTAPTNITQAQSSADELKKFKELLDSGVITQEEFDAKKKQLLGL